MFDRIFFYAELGRLKYQPIPNINIKGKKNRVILVVKDILNIGEYVT